MTSAVVSKRAERSRVARNAHNSLVVKSVKERYIRVAAIDIMISAGVWNICRISRNHENHALAVTVLGILRDREDLEFEQNQTRYSDWRRNDLTIQIQADEYL